MNYLSNWLPTTRALLWQSVQVYLTLLKIMIPALVAVKLLQEWGAIDQLGALLSPVMSMVGLPASMGVVWATTLLTNVFTGVVIFIQIAGDMTMTVEQVTVLGTLMLIGHSIPVEGAVARRAGVPWWVTIALRVGGALFLGYLLHITYTGLDLYQEQAQIIWQPAASDSSWTSWAIAQLNTLVLIFFIILALIVLLKVLSALGLERLIHIGLSPLLRVMGIGQAAANTTVIGVALGLSYGAGLLIHDLEKGGMSRRDGFLALCFLGLAHSVIEDTLVIMAIGADLTGIFWSRLIFSIVVVALLARFVIFLDTRRATAGEK
jgi:spore maturation protein SpmB